MTHVTFGAVVRAQEATVDVAKHFFSNSILKKSRGKLVITKNDLGNPKYMNACVETTKKMTGGLHLHINGNLSNVYECDQLVKFAAALDRLSYVSNTIESNVYEPLMVLEMLKISEITFYYIYESDGHKNLVYYRPALLNGRHVVDILRVVCGPADVSEAELDRVRREAKTITYVGLDLEGVLVTAVVTAQGRASDAARSAL